VQLSQNENVLIRAHLCNLRSYGRMRPSIMKFAAVHM